MKGIYIRSYRLSRVIIIAWLLYQVIFGGKYWIDTWFNPPYASAGNIEVFAKGQILICSNYDRLELYDMHLESWTRLGGEPMKSLIKRYMHGKKIWTGFIKKISFMWKEA